MVDQARLASCTIRRAMSAKWLSLEVGVCLFERPVDTVATLSQLLAGHSIRATLAKHYLANTGQFKD